MKKTIATFSIITSMLIFGILLAPAQAKADWNVSIGLGLGIQSGYNNYYGYDYYGYNNSYPTYSGCGNLCYGNGYNQYSNYPRYSHYDYSPYYYGSTGELMNYYQNQNYGYSNNRYSNLNDSYLYTDLYPTATPYRASNNWYNNYNTYNSYNTSYGYLPTCYC